MLAATHAESVVTSVGAVRATLGAVATTTGAVIPVFLVGGLVAQIAHEPRFSPADWAWRSRRTSV